MAVTGATGRVGAHLLALLLARAFRVQAISRNPPLPRLPEERVRWIRAELSRGWPEDADAPCLLSAGPLAELAEGFRRRPPHGLRRLIALSSTSIRYKQSSTDPREREQAERLLAAEQSLAATCRAIGAHLTLLRPTLIYGTASESRLGALIAFARITRILPLPWPAQGLRQPVHAEDLAALMLALLEHPRAGVFEVGGGERLSVAEMIERMVRAETGSPLLAVPVPARWIGSIFPRWRGPLSRLGQDQLPRREPELEALGWRPRPFLGAR